MIDLWHIYVSEEEATASKMMSMRAVLPQVHLESMRDKVAYLHAVMGFCPLSTLKMAIENKWIEVMGIKAKDIERNPPQVHCTAEGYMKMSTIGWNSRGKGIEKQVMELAQEHPLANVPGEDRLNAMYSWVYETRDTMHADAMGDVNWVSS